MSIPSFAGGSKRATGLTAAGSTFAADNQAAAKKQGEKGGGKDQPPTDYEIKRMLERRMERMERVSAH